MVGGIGYIHIGGEVEELVVGQEAHGIMDVIRCHMADHTEVHMAVHTADRMEHRMGCHMEDIIKCVKCRPTNILIFCDICKINLRIYFVFINECLHIEYLDFVCGIRNYWITFLEVPTLQFETIRSILIRIPNGQAIMWKFSIHLE